MHETASNGFEIRRAGEQDISLILAFVKDLAEYERLSHLATATERPLRMGCAGLERAIDSLLQIPGRAAAGRLDHLPSYRHRAASTCPRAMNKNAR